MYYTPLCFISSTTVITARDFHTHENFDNFRKRISNSRKSFEKKKHEILNIKKKKSNNYWIQKQWVPQSHLTFYHDSTWDDNHQPFLERESRKRDPGMPFLHILRYPRSNRGTHLCWRGRSQQIMWYYSPVIPRVFLAFRFFHPTKKKKKTERKRETYRSNEVEVEFIGGEKHIGAGIPVKHELTVSVGA